MNDQIKAGENKFEALTASDKLSNTKKNIFKWHRYIGLITIIPVIFWCLSGLMHPFLSHWFKPSIAREFLQQSVLDKTKITFSVAEVLRINHIQEFKNFRIVQFKNEAFYQVKLVNDELRYYNSTDAKILKDGDKQYAEFMARYFTDDQTSPIKSISLQTEFDQQYKYINRYLPVWKVSFDRPDEMDVFVETASSRMGTFNTTSRKVFLWVFDNFHNWSFLESITNNTLRVFIMVMLLGVILLSAITGIIIYGLFWNRFKNMTNEKKGLRKYHRQIGIATAFIALTFAFSGAFHATRKLIPNTLPTMAYKPVIKADSLQIPLHTLKVDWNRVHNISIVRKGKQNYYQIFYTKTEDEPSDILYINASNGLPWENGNIKYAEFLGRIFFKALSEGKTMAACCEEMGGKARVDADDVTPVKTQLLSVFNSREYGFVFKRLPVIQLEYDTEDNQTLYIETATSRLAASVKNADRIEGYSFAIFHKYLLMDWAGKNIRDIIMMISALGLLATSVMGLLIFIKKL